MEIRERHIQAQNEKTNEEPAKRDRDNVKKRHELVEVVE